jgi:hypothetical protein
MSRCRTTLTSMIDPGSLAGLHEHRHRLDACCRRCDRWAKLDRAARNDAGHGDCRPEIRVPWRACGKIGPSQVRPPVPMCAEPLSHWHSWRRQRPRTIHGGAPRRRVSQSQGANPAEGVAAPVFRPVNESSRGIFMGTSRDIDAVHASCPSCENAAKRGEVPPRPVAGLEPPARRTPDAQRMN